VLSGKISKFSITSVLCAFPDSVPVLVSRVLRDRCQLKTESELTFAIVVVYFGVLVCSLCSMDEMLIRFSLVCDRWMTTPMPHFEPMDGSVMTGCTAPGFLPCSRRVAPLRLHGASRVSRPPIPSVRDGVLQGPCGHSSSPHRPNHDGLVYHGSG
jgi:hypothetical protein